MQESRQIGPVISIVFSLFLALLIGSWLTHKKAFPFRPYLNKTFFALETYLASLDSPNEIAKKQFWSPARFRGRGLTHIDESKVHDGYTFFCSREGTTGRLLDNRGNTLHRWSKAFDKAWPEPTHMSSPAKSEHIFWELCHLFPNGDILVVYKAAGHFPGGHGMVKLDADSNVKWRYPGHVHHDVEIAPDGQILALTRQSTRTPSSLYRHDATPSPRIFESFIVWVSPSGDERKRVSLVDALLDSDYSNIATTWGGAKLFFQKPFDPFHFNDIERVPESFARKFSEVEPGDILISSRDLNALLVLDPTSERIVWAQKAFWSAQHDPDFVENGHVLLFDNLGLWKKSRKSRIIIYDPVSYEILWSYSGSGERKLSSHVMGEQQMLPNENVLIAESRAGRILEVTPDGEIVWEYINETRERFKGDDWIPSFSFGVKKYSPEELTFIE